MPDDTTVQMPDVVDGTLGEQAAAMEPVAEPAAEPVVAPAPAVSEPAINPAATPSTDIPASPTVVMPGLDVPAEEKPVETKAVDVPAQVAQRISEAHNVLIALSADPSVDELATAIGLSLYLDKIGKRATAIYSGATPNALEFLKPEETFEESVDVLQDFVIALNKEKADHLRYKLDGDFVKIYITPYRTKVSQEDLEFSYGDYNVDLVLALDVANGVDLDTALREHGRIMHDAVIINITTGNPGKLGEIEWSDKHASSVAEMVAGLLYRTSNKVEIEKGEATAFLTGIVAATNRFSNAKTTPDTMTMSSRLMKSGANQQLISQNITPDVDNEMFNLARSEGGEIASAAKDGDPTKLDILHGNEEGVKESDEKKVVDTAVTEKESTLMDDLKAAEENLKAAGDKAESAEEAKPMEIQGEEATTKSLAEMANEVQNEIDSLTKAKEGVEAGGELAAEPAVEAAAEPVAEPEPVAGEAAATEDDNGAAEPEQEGLVSSSTEKTLQPSENFNESGGSMNKYGQMLEEALAQANGAAAGTAPIVSSEPATQELAMQAPTGGVEMPEVASAAPVNTEANAVPAEYMPEDAGAVLPPPPTPPIDMGSPEAPTGMEEPVMPNGTNDAGQFSNATFNLPGVETPAPEVASQPQNNDPAAFKIPGA